ncbi:MAG: SPFH domain-containing protein [Lachnospiraceae bacterium]|nr:SPFH domain-containing protein [Lachnospiraceae bacterium]
MEHKISVVEEKKAKTKSGGLYLLLDLLGWAADIAAFVFGIIFMVESIDNGTMSIGIGVTLLVASLFGMIGMIIFTCGFHIIQPNQAIVFTLFGKYYGTVKEPGFYYVNPFCSAVAPAKTVSNVATQTAAVNVANGVPAANVTVSMPSKKISLRTRTLNNERQKVNDVLGNPIIIGANVIWKVADPTAAVFNVENFGQFLSTQCDSVIRNIARLYPYDTMEEDSEEKTLRGSSNEIAEQMEQELQARVADAGLEIIDVRITHLAYSEEIAAAMLQRQQAVAIIAARQKIVEGAVSMVKMAIDQLGEEEIVVLDEERKAAMVSNLLVVLCGNKDAQPIVNSGSIY